MGIPNLVARARYCIFYQEAGGLVWPRKTTLIGMSLPRLERYNSYTLEDWRKRMWHGYQEKEKKRKKKTEKVNRRAAHYEALLYCGTWR